MIAACRHHWLIDSPMIAHTSRGVCRSCGESREFLSWQRSDHRDSGNSIARTIAALAEPLEVDPRERGKIIGTDADKRRIRYLPEFTQYRDEGCEVNPACLTCPLPQCIYEHDTAPMPIQERDAEIIRLSRSGVRTAAIAAQFELTSITVRRILKRIEVAH